MATSDTNKIIYKISDQIISREIEGELIIIPISSGVGDMEDELYSLNETGKAIWYLVNGERTLSQIISILQKEFDDTTDTLVSDVENLANELLKRNIFISVEN